MYSRYLRGGENVHTIAKNRDILGHNELDQIRSGSFGVHSRCKEEYDDLLLE